jgi:hypothetical protein
MSLTVPSKLSTREALVRIVVTEGNWKEKGTSQTQQKQTYFITLKDNALSGKVL